VLRPPNFSVIVKVKGFTSRARLKGRPEGGTAMTTETTRTTHLPRPGDAVRLVAYKSDGTAYRWGTVTVQAVTPEAVILEAPIGTRWEMEKGAWETRDQTRFYLWFGRPYNLFEAFFPDGRPHCLYMNVASPPEFHPGVIRYTDYELDIFKLYGEPAKVLDADEFAEAVETYGYTPDFQQHCWAVMAEGLKLVEEWRWSFPPLPPGSQIRLNAYKSDGHCYRWTEATVVETQPNLIRLEAPAGTIWYGDRGEWISPFNMRLYLWNDRDYNLMEVYRPNGTPIELYVHIASPVDFQPGELRYTDWELDVVKHWNAPAKVEDEAEFEEAIQRYGYTASFQTRCRQAVAAALALVEGWPWPAK
jgi:protein associated with RNAse G/E